MESIEKDGMTIKSQVAGWSDWSTAVLPKDVREAAEWLLVNGYENERDVKSAFYDRQTSSMSDDYNAEEKDNAAIVSVAKIYQKKQQAERTLEQYSEGADIDAAIEQSFKKVGVESRAVKAKEINEKQSMVVDGSKEDFYQNKNIKRLLDLESNVPTEMKSLNQWCPFKMYFDKKDGKTKKFVLDVNTGKWAKSNDIGTWSSFDDALKFAKENNCAGLSFALNKNNITCIDLDKCIDKDGNKNATAERLLALLPDTYSERSVSGAGIHIFIADNILADKFNSRKVLNNGQELEVYNTGRFMSMTGDLISKTNQLSICPEELKKNLQKTLGEKTPEIKREYGTTDMSDRDVIERIQKSKKGQIFSTLYSGGSVTGDKSRDDFTILNMLAFFTDCDPRQMESIFKSSGLYRPDKGQKYLNLSINNAIDKLSIRPTNLGGQKSKNTYKASAK